MILVCMSCLAKNRVSDEKMGDDPRCGKCQSVLLTAKPVTLNEQNFSTVIQHHDLPILVDLWAPWCGPCKMMAPFFEDVAKDYPYILFGKLNTEENPRLSQAFNVRSIPTLVLMNKTTEIARVSGAMRKNEIKQWLEQYR